MLKTYCSKTLDNIKWPHISYILLILLNKLSVMIVVFAQNCIHSCHQKYSVRFSECLWRHIIMAVNRNFFENLFSECRDLSYLLQVCNNVCFPSNLKQQNSQNVQEQFNMWPLFHVPSYSTQPSSLHVMWINAR